MTARAGGLAIALAVALSGCGDEDHGDQEAFCTELRQSIDQNVTVFDPQDPADPAEARAVLDELATLAPAEIRPHVVVLRDAFAELATAIAELDLDDPSAADQLGEIELDEERIARAQSTMAVYGRDPCRIPLLNGPASATTLPATTVPVATTTGPAPDGSADEPPATTVPAG